MHTIDTVIFDLGGVLIDWNPRYLFRKMFATTEEMEYFLGEVCTSSWNHEQDRGRGFEEGIASLLPHFPQYSAPIQAYWQRWEEMLGGDIQEMVALQQTLIHQQVYKVLALTNWSHETMPIAKRYYSFLNDFHGMLVSGEEKLAKPEPEIYHLLFKRFDVNPQKAVFIDDSQANIQSAIRLGLKTIHFQTPRQAITELRTLLNW